MGSVCGYLTALALLLATVSAEANMGNPRSGGSLLGEATGLSTITITREELSIDLRPLADHGLALVNATYHVDNPGEAKQIDVVFVSGDRPVDFSAVLDGKPLLVTSLPAHVELPESWRGRGDQGNRSVPLGVRLEIPAGRHDVVVTYKADASHYRGHKPMVEHELAYILAPARTWGGFGGLDITVHVPAGWDIDITPPLKRTGDRLTGTFSSIPADAVDISVHAPEGHHGLFRLVALLLFAIVLFGGGYWVVSRAGIPNRSALVAFARGIVWSVAIIGSGVAAVYAPDLAIDKQQVNSRGYGDGLAIVGTVLLALITFIASSIIAIRVARRIKDPGNDGRLQ